MVQRKFKNYELTGEVFKEEEGQLFETAQRNMYWFYTGENAHLVTKHEDMPNILLGLYSPNGIELLAPFIKIVPKSKAGSLMLLPGEYITVGDMIYILEKRTPVAGQGVEQNDNINPLDDIVKGASAVNRSILDSRVNQITKMSMNLMKNIAFMAYRSMYLLRELYSSVWEQEHVEQMRMWSHFSNSVHTKEEAALLAIKMVEDVLDADKK